MRARLLITGLSGFLGAHCAWRLRGAWRITGTVHHAPVAIPGVRQIPLDLADRAAVREAVRRVRPDVILHTAAMTNVEDCRRCPVAATRANVHGTAALVEAARDWDARLVNIGTDLVFDGRNPPYAEDAAPHPLSHYGRTKLAAERIVRRLGPRGCTLRTSILYGWPRGPHGCFLDWFVRALNEPKPLGLFTDQHRAFLHVEDAVQMIARVLARPTMPPLLHLAGGERASRYTFGEQFCRIFGYPATRIARIKMRDLPGLAARPTDCSMTGDRCTARYGFRARGVADGLLALSRQSPAAVFGPHPPHDD